MTYQKNIIDFSSRLNRTNCTYLNSLINLDFNCFFKNCEKFALNSFNLKVNLLKMRLYKILHVRGYRCGA